MLAGLYRACVLFAPLPLQEDRMSKNLEAMRRQVGAEEARDKRL